LLGYVDIAAPACKNSVCNVSARPSPAEACTPHPCWPRLLTGLSWEVFWAYSGSSALHPGAQHRQRVTSRQLRPTPPLPWAGRGRCRRLRRRATQNPSSARRCSQHLTQAVARTRSLALARTPAQLTHTTAHHSHPSRPPAEPAGSHTGLRVLCKHGCANKAAWGLSSPHRTLSPKTSKS